MIQQYIAGGFNGGGWNGLPAVSTGVIRSSPAASGPAGLYGVGYADSADGIVVGQPANTVEVRYTVMGDANLDRIVNSADAILMTRNYLVAGRTACDQGNFNYDSIVNSSDSALLQKNWNATAIGSAVPASTSSKSAASDSRRLHGNKLRIDRDNAFAGAEITQNGQKARKLPQVKTMTCADFVR